MEIKKDIKNDLMKRREVSVVISLDKTPSYAEASKLLADHFKVSEDAIMVEKVEGKFGRSTFLINASLYHNNELKEEAFKRLVKQKKTGAAPAA